MQFIDLKYFSRMCKSPSLMNEEAVNEFRENDLCPVNGFHPHIRVPKMRRSIQWQSQGDQFLLLGPISLHGICPADLSRKPERYPSLPAGNPVQALSPSGERSPAIPLLMPIRPEIGGFMQTSRKSSSKKPESFTPPIPLVSNWIKPFTPWILRLSTCVLPFSPGPSSGNAKGPSNSILFWICMEIFLLS